jgi:lipopolysaccharide/colanic/teichoic acid biosynthesis glycosyltransferase
MTVHNDNYVANEAVALDVFQDRLGNTGSVSQADSFYATTGKRALDVFLVIISLPIVLPVMLVVAVLISLDGCGPFYRQARVGKNGRVFTMWKLRSMVQNADELLEDTLEKDPAARQEWNSKQKLTNDPRITPIGRFVRKTSLDELPQLFNVLSGDMSLVGPRPMMPEQRKLYRGRAYYQLRPGVSGNWQISD